MRRRVFLMAAPLALAGCGSGEAVWAPEAAVARARYRHDGPPALTLYTVNNLGTGNGAHSALLINASERVLFDPAGSFGHGSIPERNDVLFGMHPQAVDAYASYHSRASYVTVEQVVEVPAPTAERALRLALGAGPVAQAHCTRVTSGLLAQLPGFEGIDRTWFPHKLMADFGALPGVVTTEHNENDSDSLTDARRAVARRLES
ncbi:hypothetical protein [Limimaricola hongkongensis]|uniref:Lipoprotein n=1 Tax=Limimaricola hongkongensis DSM 17492 TaxID=1122180 RepID=A0A017HC49_9RHOB|nr:hypothetical protein [Limimaricola hongkongensis]EYD72037.1 hypothetical protein Lokhon_02109 [Limimaricola hongkongensis DSM 17492]